MVWKNCFLDGHRTFVRKVSRHLAADGQRRTGDLKMAANYVNGEMGDEKTVLGCVKVNTGHNNFLL